MAVVIALAGCSDDDSSRPVELCVTSYSLAQYREGDGPWVTATPDARGASTLDVGNDFEFVGVIDDSGFVYVTQWRSTVREWNADHAATTPLACAPATPSPVQVTGSVTQDAIVSLDGDTVRTSGSPFSFYVEPGTYDLVASFATSQAGGKVFVQRDLAVTGATTLPAIDPSQGVDLVPRPIQISNASQPPAVRTFLLVDGATNFAEIAGRTGGMVDIVPSTVLASDDEQWIYVDAPGAGAEIEYKGSIPAIDLLPPLSGIAFESFNTAPSASWAALPTEYHHIAMSIQGEANGNRLAFQELYTSRGWNEAYGATSIGLASAIPGFESGWGVNPGTLSSLTTTVYMPPRDGVTLWTQARP